ncbi:MAG: glycine cleavage system aminomethyltransferase GcvT, partial [Calditrichota bacterium]
HGGVVDDLLVYRFADHYMTVVNASNLDKDYEWLKSHLEGDVQLKNVSDEITLLAIQGPRAIELVNKLTDNRVDDIEYYHFREGKAAGATAIISRTGYTGEIGFELFIPSQDSDVLWEAVFEAGTPLGLKPIGLGARDSLRLEVAYCLYGNDIDQTTNPLEAGLGWIFKGKKKGGFIGLDASNQAREAGLTRRLVGFNLEGKSIARHNAEVFAAGAKVGYVTSGGYSPMLDKVVGLAYVNKPYDVIGGSLQIDVRGKMISAVIVEPPFYQRPE